MPHPVMGWLAAGVPLSLLLDLASLDGPLDAGLDAAGDRPLDGGAGARPRGGLPPTAAGAAAPATHRALQEIR